MTEDNKDKVDNKPNTQEKDFIIAPIGKKKYFRSTIEIRETKESYNGRHCVTRHNMQLNINPDKKDLKD